MYPNTKPSMIELPSKTEDNVAGSEKNMVCACKGPKSAVCDMLTESDRWEFLVWVVCWYYLSVWDVAVKAG